MSNFKEGDVVQLKSGSPLMTISFVRTDGSVIVSWYDGDSGSIKTEVIKSTILQTA